MRDTCETLIEFGPFRLDRAHRELTKAGQPVPLGDRAFEILLVLIAHAPEVVSKAILFAQAWRGLQIEESTLRFHMSLLRKALGDGEDGKRYISTASGRGYCFVAPLAYVPAATAQPPEPAKAETAATNLPMRLTPIIGRERELAELEEWLARYRLVTLVGPGGVGKTRLAVELAWRMLQPHPAGAYPAGIWLIDLAPVADADGLLNALSTRLGIAVSGTDAAATTLVSALGKARLLLIFDNCEHLAVPAAALIKTLLEGAPGVSVLATSQRNLNVRGEQVYAVDPLELPPAGATEIEAYAAARLFLACARARDRQFVLDAAGGAEIGEICRQLDGLPLALEMAAGRLRMLGVSGLRRGLDDRLRLIRGTTTGHARHSSLYGMLEWSHSLLEPLDQKVFRRLAVFSSSFSLEAAIAVTGWDEAERWTVIDALGRLIDRSLVTLAQRAPPRYRLLETLSLFAADKLREADETDMATARHAGYFVTVFEEAERNWEEMLDPDWFARYQPELDHLRSAIGWALAAPERSQIAVSLVALGSVLFRWLPLLAEGIRYFDRVAHFVNADTPPAIAIRLLENAATFCLYLNDPRGLGLAERAVALCREHNDPCLPNALVTYYQLMSWYDSEGDAEKLLVEASQLAAGMRLKKTALRVMGCEAGRFYDNGDMVNSRRSHLQALELARSLKSRREALLVSNLSLVEYVLGDVDQAIALVLSLLSYGDHSVTFDRKGPLLVDLADFLIAKGEFSEAWSQLAEAVTIQLETGDFGVECLRLWAILAGFEGRLVAAARMVGCVKAIREAGGGFVADPANRRNDERLAALLEAGIPQAERDALMAEGAKWAEADAMGFVAGEVMKRKSPA